MRRKYRDRDVSYEDVRTYVLQNLPHLAARNMVVFERMKVFNDELSGDMYVCSAYFKSIITDEEFGMSRV